MMLFSSLEFCNYGKKFVECKRENAMNDKNGVIMAIVNQPEKIACT